MQATRRSRVITCAIAGSLALHCVAAIGLRNVRPVQAAPEQRPARVSIARIATPPPPTPTPPPSTPPPRTYQTPHRPSAPRASHPAITAAHVAGARSAAASAESHVTDAGGPANGSVVATAVPTATPKPSCRQPNVAASVIDAVSADTPDDAGATNATVQVEVTLDAAGHVADAQIYKSANDFRLDHAALVAAKRSTYAAEIVDCIPRSGNYLFVVDFQS